MKTVAMTIPYSGYKIKSRELIIDMEKACDLITPRLQMASTKAVRGEKTVTVIKHVAVCPYCGKEIPAYAGNGKINRDVFIRTSDEIDMWLNDQQSFFGGNTKELVFNKPAKIIDRFICSKCSAYLEPGDGEQIVEIIKSRKKITVKLKLDMTDILKIDWIRDFEFTNYLFESVTFNLNNGHTYLCVTDADGKCCGVLDITGKNISKMKSDPVIDLLDKSRKFIFRELKRMLQPYWNGRLPFAEKNLNTERCILLTRFVGYDRKFYSSVPCVDGENRIDGSFADAIKKLHTAKSVPEILKSSGIPCVKSVKKIIYSEPSLLFYRSELEKLWDILGDLNYFRRLLLSEDINIYKILSYLHERTVVFSFLKEYAESEGVEALFRLLTGNDIWRYYAPVYITMNEYRKKEERKRWKNECGFDSGLERDPLLDTGRLYSIPTPRSVRDETELPPDCMIKGYSFIRLRKTYDYIKAGAELKNCLKDWEQFEGRVYGVVKDGRYVAAVELEGKQIIQARTFGNNFIDTNKSLYEVFEIWKNNNRLFECEPDMVYE